MKHQKTLVKLLRKFLGAQKLTSEMFKQAFDEGYMNWSIPDELLTNEMLEKGESSLWVWGESYLEYQSLVSALRKETELEYITDKQLKDKLWYLVCDVYINRKCYSKNKKELEKKAEHFLSEIFKPIEEYQVIFGVDNLDIGSENVDFYDCNLTKFDRGQFSLSGNDPFSSLTERIFSDFAGKTVIQVTEVGNKPNLIAERARKKAINHLHFFKAALSNPGFLADENLLFELSEKYIMRKVSDPSKIYPGWKRRRFPFGFKYSDGLDEKFTEANEIFERLKSLPQKIKDRVERALIWFGKSIAEENLDEKVIKLFTAIETLITLKSDSKKGEKIAYRVILLQSIMDDDAITPALMLWLYGEIRSNVIHGSAMGYATKRDYDSLLGVTRKLIFNFIQFAKDRDIHKLNDLIKALETSDKVKQLTDWLQKQDDGYSNDVLEALNKSLEQYSAK